MLLLCLTGTLALGIGGIIPSARSIDATKNEIAELQASVRQQETLMPVYLQMQEHKHRQLPEVLQLPDRGPLLLDNLADLPSLFEALARASGLQLISATPQVQSLRDGREMVRVDTRMRGTFETYHPLLLRLNKMPYVEKIESFAIEVGEAGQEIRLSIWLAIQ